MNSYTYRILTADGKYQLHRQLGKILRQIRLYILPANPYSIMFLSDDAYIVFDCHHRHIDFGKLLF